MKRYEDYAVFAKILLPCEKYLYAEVFFSPCGKRKNYSTPYFSRDERKRGSFIWRVFISICICMLWSVQMAFLKGIRNDEEMEAILKREIFSLKRSRTGKGMSCKKVSIRDSYLAISWFSKPSYTISKCLRRRCRFTIPWRIAIQNLVRRRIFILKYWVIA